jgi:Tol biopolymer transport system component
MTRQLRRILLLAAMAALCVAFVPPLNPQTQDQAEVALKAAMDKETVDGNLQAAIEQYRNIVKLYPANRTVAAKALMRMGQCYEKLGKAEARAAYERLLREYSEQPEAAAARTRLAALAGPRSTGMVARRLWISPMQDTEGTISPDGHQLAYLDWQNGDIVLRDLTTGAQTSLTKGPGIQSGQYGMYPRFSPDGRQVAYMWFQPDESGKGEVCELRVVGLDGSQPRRLYRDPAGCAFIRDWSPDGKQVLATLRGGKAKKQLISISVADGSTRALKDLSPWFPTVQVSPDGRYIAYDEDVSGTNNHDIFLLSTGTLRPSPLVEHAADEYLLGWTPDGKKVLFLSDRSGTYGLWSIAVAEGKAAGPPEQLKQDMGLVEPIGIARNGSFYYATTKRGDNIQVAGLDLAGGRVVEAPTPAVQRFVGDNFSPAWSPDGKYLAYAVARHAHKGVGFTDEVIVIRSLANGSETEMLPKDVLVAANGPGLMWRPDGKAIMFRGYKVPNQQLTVGYYAVDLQTHESSPLVLRDQRLMDPVWSGDGRELLYARRHPDGPPVTGIYRRTVDTGEEKELHSFKGNLCSLALSPDGRQLAFSVAEPKNDMQIRGGDLTSLRILTLASGEEREVVRFAQHDVMRALAWSADGRYLLFGNTTPETKTSELWSVSAQGSEPHKIGISFPGIQSLSVHPDGKRVAFTARSPEVDEIWVLENFLPPLKAK